MIGLVIFARHKGRRPAFHFPSGSLVAGIAPTFRVRLSKGIFLIRIAALILIITALCRPQEMIEESIIETEGIDIILTVDTSTSMLAEDFELEDGRANRLKAVKEVMKEFIENRTSDRIGIVAFAAKAYTVSPLTLDYGWLIQNLDRVEIGMIEDGTAIGSSLTSSLNRLNKTEAKSKVVILLTDGVNNRGKIAPLVAAEAAGALDIKVYTIGAGTKGYAPVPARDLFGRRIYQQQKVVIDEDTLKSIAEKTGAKYFRATDTESLRAVYSEIDQLETTPIEEQGYVEYKELFHLFLIPGLILLLLEIILNNTLLRRIP